jgi:rod shape-determining protein MreB
MFLMIKIVNDIKKIRIPFFSKFNVYVDLGTSTTRVAIKDKGVILREPTFIGYNNKTKEAIFFGDEAKSILGKTPEFIKTIKPLNNGIINDFDAEVALIKFFLNKSTSPFISKNYLLKPPVQALTVFPIIATEIEQKAVEEVLVKAGCYSVILIDKPLATAAGCKIDILENKPHMIVDMGGGMIEISIISSGGIIAGKTLKTAGENMDKVI